MGYQEQNGVGRRLSIHNACWRTGLMHEVNA